MATEPEKKKKKSKKKKRGQDLKERAL